jgi:PEGA domain
MRQGTATRLERAGQTGYDPAAIAARPAGRGVRRAERLPALNLARRPLPIGHDLPGGLEHDCGRGEPRMFWKRRTKAILAVMLAIVGLSGCVERRYTIRTDPPGALVIANGEEIGVTPVSKAYTYYGIRRFRILREGYDTLDIDQPFEPPWYDNYLTEFFTENVIPYTFRDERTLTYKLSTEKQADKVPLTERAEALRAEAKTLPPPRRGGILGFFGLD